MTNHQENITQQPSTCPTRQMSFADVARYLQDGFDEPVQRALSAHIQYCNACQDELDRVQAIMSTGRHLMGSEIVESEGSGTDSMLSEALVAAYLDGNLSENERNLVTQHLADNYSSYAMFSSVEKELSSPVAASAPDRALSRVKVDVPVPVPSYLEELKEQFASWVASTKQLFELKWPAPALAFAAGVIAMIVFIPASRTIVPIPGAGIVDDNGGKIHSGLMEAAPGMSVVTLPESVKGDVSFTWAPVESAEYRAEISSTENGEVLLSSTMRKAEWTVDSDMFESGQVYTLFVTASTPDTGIRPVATITVVKQ